MIIDVFIYVRVHSVYAHSIMITSNKMLCILIYEGRCGGAPVLAGTDHGHQALDPGTTPRVLLPLPLQNSSRCQTRGNKWVYIWLCTVVDFNSYRQGKKCCQAPGSFTKNHNCIILEKIYESYTSQNFKERNIRKNTLKCSPFKCLFETGHRYIKNMGYFVLTSP